MTVTAISAVGLTLTRGGRQLCVDCDLELPVGELTVVVGPNGSGKTTLLQTLAGLRTPTAGRVVHHVDPPLGYLPQRPAFRAGFTVAETLEYYRQLAPAGGRASVPALLERVGLGGRADDPVDGLSGGMMRLFAVGVALIGDPPVLLLDEPTGGLDPQMRDAIVAIVSEEREGGRAVVLVTHGLGAIDPLVDRVVVMGEPASVTVGAKDTLCEQTGTGTLEGLYRQLTEVGP
jgi:ABC-type multidrug transport system, ATPase component